jgi:hypothetical protein
MLMRKRREKEEKRKEDEEEEGEGRGNRLGRHPVAFLFVFPIRKEQSENF